MKLEQLNFHHLFYFYRVAKVGHLTRAAEELHTSQSSLSAQIRQLEERLGEVLFVREGRRLVLTNSGQLALAYAENIFGLGQEMLSRLEGRSEGVTRLRIGSVATLSRNYQENRIRPLLTDPSVVLTLESGMLDDLLARLIQHQLDLVLANETVPSDPNRPLLCRFLGSQAISLVGPAAKWQPYSLRVPEDLDGMEIALPGQRSAFRAQFDAAPDRARQRLADRLARSGGAGRAAVRVTGLRRAIDRPAGALLRDHHAAAACRRDAGPAGAGQ
jgi:LysR family transcriptional regulator, transcriptional activator of nhaA